MSHDHLLKSIPIEWLIRGKYQPRENFEQNSLNELAQSISTQGLIEPLIVRYNDEQSYEIIAGERRWRAAMIAGLSDVPCIIGNYTNQQAATVTLVENIQRQDLTIMEEANGYQRLVDEFNFSQIEVATLVGKSRSHIANTLRILTLCTFVQQQIQSNKLTLGHAKMLVGLPVEDQTRFAVLIEKNNWSVRKLENNVRNKKYAKEAANLNQSDINVKHLERHLAEQIGTPVAIDISGEEDQSGWLKVKFYDNDTLSGLLEKLGLHHDI